MDGNGRWAESKNKSRFHGHQEGVKSVDSIVKKSVELGIKFLTLYAFSTENWNRPKEEVDALMELLVQTIREKIPTLNENGISLNAIGDINALPKSCAVGLNEAIDITSTNKNLTLTLALSYSAKWDILNAIKQISKEIEQKRLESSQLNEGIFRDYLTTRSIPDPDMLIRTGGEQRISNFLLWECAYTEFYFTDTYWPDFKEKDLEIAINNYQMRERRFGKTSSQIRSVK